MSETAVARVRSPLEMGVAMTLVVLGVAAVAGFIAVFDAENVASGFGTGFGIAFAILLAGGTLATALACLVRRRVETMALAAIATAGLAVDLLVVAVWLDIDDEGYGKLTALAFVWSLFTLVVLGLALAVGSTEGLARGLYLGAAATALTGGLISSWLVLTADGGGVGVAGGGVEVPFAGAADDELLRLLGASLVLLATLWFAALAASRLERPASADA